MILIFRVLKSKNRKYRIPLPLINLNSANQKPTFEPTTTTIETKFRSTPIDTRFQFTYHIIETLHFKPRRTNKNISNPV